ncbi:methyl-accepting chemotaxis protein [Natronobacterium gregoryi]|uniref:Methyl-accepting chemotaxis protein n=3 Tax=Natronobacterium gregoryi TaxID=44930 RepID=L0ACN3_NATGS|nr:methyl-accepting chemotaxis protein [Natronobacterium gregoryi SP2]ELY66651.1 methyl-accepting chemotaxis sensory transducer [Natronobacterium gregoryi SP2]PLK21363.1 methyl-accepting chemotaxis protein [Natronobacterium gregoryi SP2]SFI80894.1 methyl-accepting chemotaxis protein [Natronobacterium gregoryi]
MIGTRRSLAPAFVRRSYTLTYGLVLFLAALALGTAGLAATVVVDGVGPTETAAYGLVAIVGGALTIGLVGAALGRATEQSIDRLADSIERIEAGDPTVEIESERIDAVGRLSDEVGSVCTQYEARLRDLERQRAAARAELDSLERENGRLKRIAADYSERMQSAANGELTVRIEPRGKTESMRAIAEGFNAMLDGIEATVCRLDGFATDVVATSADVTDSSEEVRTANQEVSESIQEISQGANRQYQALQLVDSRMATLAQTTERIAASSNDVVDIAEQTTETTREGRAAAWAAIEACDDLESEYRSAVEEFDDLQRQVDRIDDLTETIAAIAEQTNVLALNANIEASRSAGGSDTDGFSTVAAEVTELSQDVKKAAEQISDRLEAVQEQTDRSATAVDRTSEEIDRVDQLVTDVMDSLDEIADYAAETTDGVREISSSTEQQAASTQGVVAIVDEVATIAETTTAEAETVAGAAKEQTAALSSVLASADELGQQATALSDVLDRFETDAGSDATVDLVVGAN